jgi:hypothetical protein
MHQQQEPSFRKGSHVEERRIKDRNFRAYHRKRRLFSAAGVCRVFSREAAAQVEEEEEDGDDSDMMLVQIGNRQHPSV